MKTTTSRGPSLGLSLRLAVLLAMLLRFLAFCSGPACPAAAPGWLSGQPGRSCGLPEVEYRARPLVPLTAKEPDGDLGAAMRIQRRRVALVTELGYTRLCREHRKQRRLHELAQLGELARARNDRHYDALRGR